MRTGDACAQKGAKLLRVEVAQFAAWYSGEVAIPSFDSRHLTAKKLGTVGGVGGARALRLQDADWSRISLVMAADGDCRAANSECQLGDGRPAIRKDS